MLVRVRFSALASRCGVVALLAVGVAVAPTTAAEAGTADGWSVVRGPGAIVATDRTYLGEPALRVDYDYTNINQHGDVQLSRPVPAGDQDWRGYSGLTMALDGEESSYAIQIRLVGSGGFVSLSTRISLNTTGWNEVYVPFHLFMNSFDTTEFDWSQVTSEQIIIRYQGGDYDPHTVYVGGWQRTPHATARLADPGTVATETVSVPLGQDVVAEFVKGRDDGLLYGLAGLSEGGTLLRTRELSHLIHPIVHLRNGISYEAFLWRGVAVDGGRARVFAESADGQVSLEWFFKPAQETIDGKLFDGVGYRYEVTSTVPVDQIDEQATWELGGTSVGNAAVLRSSAWATEVSGASAAEFDTRASDPPRFAHAAAFEYQGGALGQLLVTYEQVATITTDFVKRPGDDVFEYRDTYFLPQQASTSTPTKLVLHAAGSVNETGVELINAHTRVQDAVHQRFRQQYGVQEPRIEPTVTMGTGRQPLDDYLTNGWLADAADLGFKQILLGAIWNSDAENGGPSGATGIPVWTFDVADRWGGNPALSRLTQAAQAEGLSIGMWAPGAHMSRNAPIVEANPSWVAMGPYGAPESTFWSLAGFDLHDAAARQYLLNEITERRTADGLAGLWLDSTHSHGFAQYDHANTLVAPHAEAMAGHIGDLQANGFTVYTEARAPFGTPSSGYNTERRTYYANYEYRAYETSMNFTVPTADVDFYRFAANKALPFNSWGTQFWTELQTDSILRAEVQRVNNDYNTVAPYLKKRTVLPLDRGVEWDSPAASPTHRVLFTFHAFDYTLPANVQQVTDVTTGQQVPVSDGTLHAQAEHTYLMVLG